MNRQWSLFRHKWHRKFCWPMRGVVGDGGTVRNKWSRAKWSCDVSCGMGAELSGAVNEHVKEAGSQKSSRISQQSIHIVCLSLLVQRQSIHRLSRFTDSVDSHCVLAFACPETVDSQTQSIHRLSRFTLCACVCLSRDSIAAS
jgi:hypothetical protein